MPTQHERELYQLLGRYLPPRVRVGDVATCLYRDCDVVITSWTDALISWPRCRARHTRGGSGLLVNETLLQAIRTESVMAIKYWFGVGTGAVWAWRRAFGVKQWGTIGSRRLLELTTAKGNEAARAKVYTKSERQQKRRIAKQLNLAKHLREYRDQHRARSWSNDEVALLGTMKDTRLAKTLDRSRDDVRRERVRRGIPSYRKPPSPAAALSAEQREQLRRQRIAAAKQGKKRPPHVIEAMRKGRKNKLHSAATRAKISAAHKTRGTRPPKAGRAWTAYEDQAVRTQRPVDAAAVTGRTLQAVYDRRLTLALPDRRRMNPGRPKTRAAT